MKGCEDLFPEKEKQIFRERRGLSVLSFTRRFACHILMISDDLWGRECGHFLGYYSLYYMTWVIHLLCSLAHNNDNVAVFFVNCENCWRFILLFLLLKTQVEVGKTQCLEIKVNIFMETTYKSLSNEINCSKLFYVCLDPLGTDKQNVWLWYRNSVPVSGGSKISQRWGHYQIIPVRSVLVARLCFHRRLWFCSRGDVSQYALGQIPAGQTSPWADTPLWSDTP